MYIPPTYGPVSPYPPTPPTPPTPTAPQGQTGPYGQAPYGQAPYGQAPYGQVPYGPPPGYGPYAFVPGNPQQGALQGAMLAATADRERTVDVLKAAFVEGRMSQQEFDQRATRVLGARTYADLNAIIADLPMGPGGVTVPGYYPVAAPAAPPVSGLAIGALICGLAEVITFGIAGIPAIILGHSARAHIRETGERGDGLAVAGLVLGYLAVASWAFILLVLIGNNGG
jgi:hypothetical protein